MQISIGNNRGRVWIRALCTSSSESGSKLKGKLETEGDVRLQYDLKRRSLEAFIITVFPVKAKWEAKTPFIFM